jgi:hypothetical protein
LGRQKRIDMLVAVTLLVVALVLLVLSATSAGGRGMFGLSGRYLMVFLAVSAFAMGLGLATGQDVDIVLLPIGLLAVIGISFLHPDSRVVRRLGLADLPRRVLLGSPRWHWYLALAASIGWLGFGCFADVTRMDTTFL